MMNVVKKVGIILLITITISIINSNFAYAREDKINENIKVATTTEDIVSGANDFINHGKGNSPINEDNLKQASNLIYNTLLIVGIILAVIWSTYLGIKYMVGSVEEKANVKESIKIFIVGCIVLFGAFGIWKLVLVLTKGIDDLDATSKITIEEVAEK